MTNTYQYNGSLPNFGSRPLPHQFYTTMRNRNFLGNAQAGYFPELLTTSPVPQFNHPTYFSHSPVLAPRYVSGTQENVAQYPIQDPRYMSGSQQQFDVQLPVQELRYIPGYEQQLPVQDPRYIPEYQQQVAMQNQANESIQHYSFAKCQPTFITLG